MQVVAARNRRQEHLLVLAADVAHGVDAPGPLLPRVVPQRPERDGEFRLPSPVRSLRAHDPVRVPAHVEAGAPAAPAAGLAGLPFSHHLAVVLDPERIGAEHERVLPIVEGVEQDLDRVGVVEVGVATAFSDDEVAWLGVDVDDADVELLPIHQEPDLGVLAGGLAFVRLLLNEGGEGLRRRPQRVVHASVDDWPLTIRQVPDGQLGDWRHRLCECRRRTDKDDPADGERGRKPAGRPD